MRIITDFDGPIMDLSDRYYHVYQLCLETVKQPHQPITIFSKAKFWAYKQAQVSEQQVGIESGLTAAQAEAFKQMRDLHAHQLQYLSFDRVVPGSIAALAKIQASGSKLLVMTLRRTCELIPAFTQYDLAQFFPPHHRYCLPDDYVKHGDVEAKTQLMATALTELKPDPDTWMIGDTEADIVAAQTYNISVIGVLSGIRNRDRLEQHQPDKIVNNLAEAVDFIFAKFTSRS
ncbi:HAD family hydrolase [Chamaesiphon sp. GL140_3_metabinner_50]|uniref:HAD family hydrolase n=1 Tax=Chamaesiphon sp. GL140_3_metabinner_50 TaxID=2970812 RepID=UPI0025DC7AB5|nr:HAD family hydrolase [Chamaesiphon sp. GL140_3_metabinner_50]